jgi:hypothetical protein
MFNEGWKLVNYYYQFQPSWSLPWVAFQLNFPKCLVFLLFFLVSLPPWDFLTLVCLVAQIKYFHPDEIASSPTVLDPP